MTYKRGQIKVYVRTSTIPVMLGYLSDMNIEPEKNTALRKIFAHEDYLFELRRYGLQSAEPLIFYFSHLKDIKAKDIPDLSDQRKNGLRDKHTLWLDCVSDPQKYYNRYEKVNNILCEENIQKLL